MTTSRNSISSWKACSLEHPWIPYVFLGYTSRLDEDNIAYNWSLPILDLKRRASIWPPTICSDVVGYLVLDLNQSGLDIEVSAGAEAAVAMRVIEDHTLENFEAGCALLAPDYERSPAPKSLQRHTMHIDIASVTATSHLVLLHKCPTSKVV